MRTMMNSRCQTRKKKDKIYQSRVKNYKTKKQTGNRFFFQGLTHYRE